jgi:hypothetical protein
MSNVEKFLQVVAEAQARTIHAQRQLVIHDGRLDFDELNVKM